MQHMLPKQLQSWLVMGSRRQQGAAMFALCLFVGIMGGAMFAFLGPILAIALVVCIAGGLIMLRSTQFAFFVLISAICLLPFATLPIPNVGFSPTFLDLILLTLLVTWGFKVARKKQDRLLSSPVGLPVMAFMVSACASFVIGLSYASLTTNLARHFAELLLSILLFFLVINNVRTQEHLGQITTALILAGFAASLIGIALYLAPHDLAIRLLSTLRVFRYPAGSGVLRFVENNPDLPLRAISTSIDPNVLGGLLVIVIAMAMPQLLTRDPLPPFDQGPHWYGINWLVMPAVGVMFLCLLLTFSRGAMAGLAGALVVLALLRHRKLLVLILLAGTVLLLLPQTQWYVQHFLEGLRREDLATQMRLGEYKDALILISRHPWFGVGFGEAPDIDTYIGVSNLYLLLAEEVGIVGLSVFLLIVSLAARQMLGCLGRLSHTPRLESILLGLLTALLSALFSGIFDHYFFNINFQHAVALFWLCMGLGMAATLVPLKAGDPYTNERMSPPAQTQAWR